MAVSAEYKRYVYRVWDRLEARTGQPVHYVDARHIAAWCPSCRAGFVRIGFVSAPRPGFVVEPLGDPFERYDEVTRWLLSYADDEEGGRCTRGCTEAEIARALFA
jgi:hypothetical protein